MMDTSVAPEHFDLVIIGSGEGGKYLAWTVASTGQRVAVVERKWIGGSCPNIACLPSKNIIHSAKVASYFFRSEEFGISKEHVHINMSKVRDRKRKMVDGLMDLHLDNFKKSGAELVMGTAHFVDVKTIDIDLNGGGKRTLRGTNVVINTGSRATLGSIPGLVEARPLTHIEALELDRIPRRLLVLGGGYIGLELSQAIRRFGSDVVLIDRNPHLVHREDDDVTEALEQLCRDEGVEVVTNVKISRVEGKSGESVKLFGTRDDAEIVLEGSDLLVAGGR